jgi:uracil phosphoribosyltransferase
MAYRVIYCEEFQKFRVRGQHSKIKLVLAWTQVSGEEIYCVNVLRSSTTMSDLIAFVRLCKEKNEEHIKKISEKEKARTI